MYCCNNFDYQSKGEPGYDPCKKIGKVFTILQDNFFNTWKPRLMKERFPLEETYISKPITHISQTKYGIKTFKLCDSTNGYILLQIWLFGYRCTFKVWYNLWWCYGGTWTIFTPFHTSHNLLKKEGTAACGTVHPHKDWNKSLVQNSKPEVNST